MNQIPNQSIESLKSLGMLIPKVGYEDEIKAFQELERKQKPIQNGILFVGDSDIRYWTHGEQFQKDFQGLPVTNRGFGGSKTWEVLLYFNELILPSSPKAIVYCCGDNDIAVLEKNGVKNAVLGFELFLEQVRLKAPTVEKIFYLGIHPSPSDEPLWGYINDANQQLRKVCAENKKVEFVDYLFLLMDKQGKLNANCFNEDGLHFSPSFYKNFANYLRPIITYNKNL
jgi:lysophospholipase L1-like esterase